MKVVFLIPLFIPAIDSFLYECSDGNPSSVNFCFLFKHFYVFTFSPEFLSLKYYLWPILLKVVLKNEKKKRTDNFENR